MSIPDSKHLLAKLLRSACGLSVFVIPARSRYFLKFFSKAATFTASPRSLHRKEPVRFTVPILELQPPSNDLLRLLGKEHRPCFSPLRDLPLQIDVPLLQIYVVYAYL